MLLWFCFCLAAAAAAAAAAPSTAAAPYTDSAGGASALLLLLLLLFAVAMIPLRSRDTMKTRRIKLKSTLFLRSFYDHAEGAKISQV